MKALYQPLLAALGWLFVALGAVGAVLPLIPTTPFLLVAAWCFDRSSPRLHAWLLRQPVLGPVLSDWRSHGVIRLRAKWVTTAMLAGFAAIPASKPGTPDWALWAMAAVILGVLAFVWTRPSRPAEPELLDPQPAVDQVESAPPVHGHGSGEAARAKAPVGRIEPALCEPRP